MSVRFPKDFRWGAATSAYQIEGAVTEDGRGPSIWDTFSQTRGMIAGGDTGDVACDHYHRYPEDVALMARMGLDDYRFSIAWPRVLPTGRGSVNEAGLDFYSRLVDELLEHEIRPVPTLYHWDLPQALQDDGGWTNRDTAARFAEYAAVVARRLGDRVPFFTTLNEPWCSAFLGHANGEHAPGLRDDAAALAAVHHLLLAHGYGAAALRSELTSEHEVSITLNPGYMRPASASTADRQAARWAELMTNQIFLDPLLHGRYPDAVRTGTSSWCDWSFVHDGDLAAIHTPIDALGVNYYCPQVIGARPQPGREAAVWPGTKSAFVHEVAGPKTAMDWLVDPDSLTRLLLRLDGEYPDLRYAITENGAAYDDSVELGDEVHDAARCDYVSAHVDAVLAAIHSGVDVTSYFLWSLLDNFEWAWGMSARFGIVHVDFATQQRTLKDSALAYRRIIEQERLSAATLEA